MKVRITSMDDSAWTEFTASHPAASPFHLPAWSSAIADCYRFDAFVVSAHDTDGDILAGIPAIAVRSPLGRKRWVALPFSDYCPVLTREDIDPGAAAGAISQFAIDSGISSLEVRAGLPESDTVHSQNVGYRHTIELPLDPAGLTPNKGHRHSRNRAVRNGVRITHGVSPEHMSVFYRLHCLTRRRHGVPVQPKRFFNLLQDRLLSRGHGFVSVATLDGETRAAAVYLTHNRTLVAKYHASDPSLPDVGAGYLVDWDSMLYGCAEGFGVLDMGRSDPDADGLRLYKSSWGASELPLNYSHISRGAAPGTRPSVGELPKQVIRRSPPWVGRALGEVLYRWSA